MHTSRGNIYTLENIHRLPGGWGRAGAASWRDAPWGKFCKVSAPVYVLYKVTIASTFENVYVIMSQLEDVRPNT